MGFMLWNSINVSHHTNKEKSYDDLNPKKRHKEIRNTYFLLKNHNIDTSFIGKIYKSERYMLLSSAIKA